MAVSACVCTRDGASRNGGADSARDDAQAFALEKDQAHDDLATLTSAPHAFGSPRQTEMTAFLATRLTAVGSTVQREPFTVEVPNPAAMTAQGPVALTLTRAGVNVWALANTQAKPDAAPCVVALASHFDTKQLDTTAYVGANDSGSSSVVLLQQIAYIKSRGAALGLTCDIVGVWFDGEEAVLKDWRDGETRHPAQLRDNTYGSRYAAARLTACSYRGTPARCLPPELGGKPLVAMILMDMIGSPDLRLSRDSDSSPALVELAARAAAALGKPDAYDAQGHAIEDDHVAYRTRGVAALDLIDFNHTDYWHAPGDEIATISYESLALAGRIALYTALAVAKDPQVFLQPTD